jgi:hypothetical protein
MGAVLSSPGHRIVGLAHEFPNIGTGESESFAGGRHCRLSLHPACRTFVQFTVTSASLVNFQTGARTPPVDPISQGLTRSASFFEISTRAFTDGMVGMCPLPGAVGPAGAACQGGLDPALRDHFTN